MSTTNTVSSSAAPAAAQPVVPAQDQSAGPAMATASKVKNETVSRFQQQSPAFLKTFYAVEWTNLMDSLGIEK